MIKRLFFVFSAICVLGVFYYLFTVTAVFLTSDIGGLFPSISQPYYGSGVSAGLSIVDFRQFTKGGSGWKYITQGYGNTPYSYMYINHWHNGIDIAARYNAPIYSPAPGGIVIAMGDQDNFCPRRAFGRFLVVEDPVNHAVLMFAHLNRILVAPGQAVTQSTEIATVGATGDETGVHLHFSVYNETGFTVTPAHGCGPYPQGHDVNPVPYLEAVE